MTLLGALVLKGKAQDKAIQDKIDDLTRADERLAYLHAHNAQEQSANTKAAVPAQDIRVCW